MRKCALAAFSGGFGGCFLLGGSGGGFFRSRFFRSLGCGGFPGGGAPARRVGGLGGARFFVSRRFPRRRLFLNGRRFRAGRFTLRRRCFPGGGTCNLLHSGGFFPGWRSLFLRRRFLGGFFFPPLNLLFFRMFLILPTRGLSRLHFCFGGRENGFSASRYQAKGIPHLRFTPFILSEVLQHEFHRGTGNQQVPIAFPADQVGIYLYPLIQQYDRGNMLCIPIYGGMRDGGRKKFALPAQKHLARAARTDRIIASRFRAGLREKILLALPANGTDEFGPVSNIPGNRKNITHKRNDNFILFRNENRRLILRGNHALPYFSSFEEPNLMERNANG